jgi:signal transduction histidine kinase
VTVEKLPVYNGVAFQLRQLFIHVLDNAIKFHQSGSTPHVNVTVALVDGNSASGLDQSQRYYRIDVTDNGIGIEPQFLDRVFELFQRLHSKDKYPGSGIGLSICRKVLENHQGVITVTSTLGEGSTFSIYLPVN